MKKILLGAVVALALATTGSATVNDQTGCGLGAMIIRDNSSAVMLALQATTNSIFGNQTFGITSGTLGCKKTQFVMNDRASEFVASNMDQLASEISKGHGESVDTLAELLNVQDKPAFASALQANYNKIYASQNAKMSDVLDNISTTAI
jgi:hypothetical protein